MCFLHGLVHFILGLSPKSAIPLTVITNLKWARARWISYYAECADDLVH